MAISRVTPSGWVQETGTVSRVTPSGWVQETVAVVGGSFQPAWVGQSNQIIKGGADMKKNVAGQFIGCQLISKTDGSAVTTGTTTIYVTGDAGTQAAGSVGAGACTHEGNGYWTYAPAQAETNYDQIAFTFVNTSACNATLQVYPTFPQTGDSFASLASGVALTAAGVDAIWDESLAAHQTALTAGRALTLGGVPIAETTVTGTPSTTSIQLTAGSTTNNYYVNQTLVIASGVGAGQARAILSYTGATRTCVFDEPFTTTPAAADAVFIKADHIHPVSEIADAVWDEVLTGATHNVTNSAGRRLRLIDAAFEVHAGTAQAGSTSTTFVMDTGASAINNIYNGDRIIIVAGTGAEEHGIIISYVGATRTATMSKAWVVTPDNTSEFAVVPAGCDIETWNHVAVTGDGVIPTAAQNATAVLTTQMTESYRAAGAAPTLAQAQFETIGHLGESSISSVTKTVKKLDGTTTAKTYTLNDATTPTSITEAT